MFFLEMKNFISDTILEPIKKLEDFFNGKVNSFLEKNNLLQIRLRVIVWHQVEIVQHGL